MTSFFNNPEFINHCDYEQCRDSCFIILLNSAAAKNI